MPIDIGKAPTLPPFVPTLNRSSISLDQNKNTNFSMFTPSVGVLLLLQTASSLVLKPIAIPMMEGGGVLAKAGETLVTITNRFPLSAMVGPCRQQERLSATQVIV